MGFVLLILFRSCSIFLSLIWHNSTTSQLCHHSNSFYSFTGCVCALLLRNMCLLSSERELGSRQKGSQGSFIFPSTDDQEQGTERQSATTHWPSAAWSTGFSHRTHKDHHVLHQQLPFWWSHSCFLVSCVHTLISTQPLTWIGRL